MKDYLSLVLAHRNEYIESAAQCLLDAPRFAVRNLKPSAIPAEAGIYIFYQLGKPRPFHIGESMNLRQRIYQNQLRGTLGQSPMKRKVKKLTGLSGDDLRTYIWDNFEVSFYPLPLGRIEVEDYLNAKFGIVESNPKANL